MSAQAAVDKLLPQIEKGAQGKLSPEDVRFLTESLKDPELRHLLKTYDRTVDNEGLNIKLRPVRTDAFECCQRLLTNLGAAPSSMQRDADELRRILMMPAMQALLKTHDALATQDLALEGQRTWLTRRHVESDGRAVVTVTIKNTSKSLGCTIKEQHDAEGTRRIVIARVFVGGAAHRTGAITAGDELLAVDGVEVTGKSVEQVVDIMSSCTSSVELKIRQHSAMKRPVSPSSPSFTAHQGVKLVRCLYDYDPNQDDWLPTQRVGLPFHSGDVLEIVDDSDEHWWQARHISDSDKVGLVPTQELQSKRTKRPANILPILIQFLEPVAYQDVHLLHPSSARPRPLVLVGAPGVGRHTIKTQLVKARPDLFAEPVPHTTRPPKPDESKDRYHFVGRRYMEQAVSQGEFVDHGEYQGTMYGISKKAIKDVQGQGMCCILDLSPQALSAMHTREFKPIVFLVVPPSLSRFRQTRGDTMKPERLARLMAASDQMQRVLGPKCDKVVVNDDLSTCVATVLDAAQHYLKQASWVPFDWRD